MEKPPRQPPGDEETGSLESPGLLMGLARRSLQFLAMTVRDKLEIGLKEDASFRKDNLPEQQVRGPQIPAGEGRSPEVPAARNDANQVAGPSKPSRQRRANRRAKSPDV